MSSSGSPRQHFVPRARVLIYGNSGNIGDAVQTVAMARLLGGQCAGVWRDAPMTDLCEEAPFVVNGWLGRGTLRLDPNALFAGIHLGFREPDYIRWIRASRFPVGARDEHTRGLLASNGIASEIIGCATLTLPRWRGPRRGRYSIDVEPVAGTEAGTSIIPDMSWADQWKAALQRLDQLRRAELVYSRRLHVILPCLAFGTPVVFPLNEYRDLFDKSRLDLLHTLGFMYDEAVELDVAPIAERFVRFLANALRTSIEPVEVPPMPVPIVPPPGDGAAAFEESLDVRFAPDPGAQRGTAPRISALVFTKNGAGQLRECLESIRHSGFVDEIVVCVDRETIDASIDVARQYTPHVHLVPPGAPEVSGKMAAAVALCAGDFVLRLDDDEQLGGRWDRQIFELLVRFNDLSHFWVPRRWLMPGDKFIASAPWGRDLHPRIFLKDPRLLSFPSRVHEHLDIEGRSLVLYDRWIDHRVLCLTSRAEREAKCRRYLELRPDHDLSEFYLPEDRDLELLPVSEPPSAVARSGVCRFRPQVAYTPGSDIDFREGGNGANYTVGAWSHPEAWGTWTLAGDAQVWLPLNRPLHTGAKVSVVAQAFVRPGHPVCRAQVLYRGMVVADWALDTAAPFEQCIVLSAGLISADRSPAFTFRNLNARSPLELKESPDPRRLSLGLINLRLISD
jgi:hypothetical protein